MVFRLGLHPVEFRGVGLGHGLGMFREFLVERLDRRGVFGKRRIDLRAGAEVVEDLLQGIEAEPFHEELHDERGLEIGELDLLPVLRLHEGAAQLADWCQLLAEDHLPVDGRQVLAPVRIVLQFLEDGDAPNKLH